MRHRSVVGFTVALFVVVAVGTLAFGAVYPWAYWPLSAAAVLLGLWGVVATSAWQDRTVRWAAVCLIAIGAAVLLQAVPLPRMWFLRLNPAADSVLVQTDLRDLIHPAAFHALAIVPDRALAAAAVFAAMGTLFVGLLRTLPRMRLDRLVGGLAAFGVLMAVFAVIQHTANVRSADNDKWQLVYGLWKPTQGAHIFGPFINRNHFAGWMIMVLSVALGYSCAIVEVAGPSRRGGWRRWLSWAMRPEGSQFFTMAVAIVAMATALTVSGSRSGIGGFAVAVAATAYVVAGRVGRGRRRVLIYGYFAALLVAAVLWAGATDAAGRFARAPTDAVSRLDVWRDTLRIIHDFPWFGDGIGSFGRAMLVYQSGNREVFYAEAHNDYLQVAADGGLLVGVPVLVGLTALVRGIKARVTAGDDDAVTFWIRTGAIAGLVGLAAQELLDFSVQMPANAMLAAVLGAIALHRPRRPDLIHDHARRL